MARSKERLRVFLFPTETDLWLGLLRIGLGLHVLLYALSLRADWNDLFAGPGEGLIGRALPEALLSMESPLVPRLGWLVMLATRIGFSELTALSLAWWVLLFAGGCLAIAPLLEQLQPAGIEFALKGGKKPEGFRGKDFGVVADGFKQLEAGGQIGDIHEPAQFARRRTARQRRINGPTRFCPEG